MKLRPIKFKILVLFLTLFCYETLNGQIVKRIAESSYLALGDSYTVGESVQVKDCFPLQLTQKLKQEGFQIAPASIVAKTGWTSDELIEGIKKQQLKSTYNLVTLLIGVNNQYRGRDTAEYRLQFRKLLLKSIDFANKTAQNVIVISIPDYGVTPFAQTKNPKIIGLEIDYYNDINKKETEILGAYYVDITPISRQALNNQSLIAEDGLHPSAKMYKLWVDKIFPIARKVLKKEK